MLLALIQPTLLALPMRILQQFPLKSVLVTGANRGIGLEMVKYFVSQRSQHNPMKIISCSRSRSEELKCLSESISHVELDVTNDDSLLKAMDDVSEIVGDAGLNLLINNAAVMYRGKGVLGCSEREMEETFRVNVLGPHSVTKRLYPLLKLASQNNSHIPPSCARAAVINISSELGSIQGTKNSYTTAYRVSKAALNMITKCQASEFIQDGVLSLSVHPGWVRTDLGGPKAPLSVQESVEDIANILINCSQEHNGMFVRKNLVSEPY